MKQTRTKTKKRLWEEDAHSIIQCQLTVCHFTHCFRCLISVFLRLLWFMAVYKCMGDKHTAIIELDNQQVISAYANLIKICGKKKKNS